MKRVLTIAITFFVLQSSAQLVPRHFKDSTSNAWIFSFNYGGNLPQNDLAQRFGYFNAVSMDVRYKTNKNWVWGLGFEFLFGNRILEKNMLDPITTPEGFLIGSDGTLIDPQFYMRGFVAHGHLAKVLPVGYNKNSGILFGCGIGLLQHKVRIDLERNTATEALNREMKKGYDRLSNGLSFSPFLGYLHLSNRGIVNFYGGLYSVYGFTQNRRSFNYDERLQDTRQRLDSFIGLKVGFVLPIYRNNAPEFYYN